MMKRTWYFLALLLLVAYPAAAQVKPADRHFLWEVTSVTNKVYLFGTVHAGKMDWYPLANVIEEAFAQSTVLVVEADVSDTQALIKSSAGMSYAPPDSIKAHVPPADYERFRKMLPRYAVPEVQMMQLKPFMAVSALVFSEWARLGYIPTAGIDAYLIRKAQADLKRVVEIEGIEQQMKLMDSLTEDEHRQIFDGTLKALEMGLTSEQITGMVNAWQSGDSALMLEVAQRYNDNIPGAKEFEEKFVWSRHPAMLAKIEGYLNESRARHFIALGSLHMVGPRGLVELLRNRGYLVKQL